MHTLRILRALPLPILLYDVVLRRSDNCVVTAT